VTGDGSPPSRAQLGRELSVRYPGVPMPTLGDRNGPENVGLESLEVFECLNQTLSHTQNRQPLDLLSFGYDSRWLPS